MGFMQSKRINIAFVLAIVAALAILSFVCSQSPLPQFSDLVTSTGQLKYVKKVSSGRSSTMMVVPFRELPELEFFYQWRSHRIYLQLHEGQMVTIWSEGGARHYVPFTDVYRKPIWQLSIGTEVILPYSEVLYHTERDKHVGLALSIFFALLLLFLLWRLWRPRRREYKGTYILPGDREGWFSQTSHEFVWVGRLKALGYVPSGNSALSVDQDHEAGLHFTQRP